MSCWKLRGGPQEQKMANLPDDHLEPAPPFTVCAVDYFGPWHIKEGRCEVKHYGVLFTCLASSAVHLEVESSHSTDSFLNAYHRFVGRCNPVRQLRSAAQLDDETLRTFMVEAEAIVDCHPLTVDTTNSPQMPEPLTPSHLLQ